MFRIYPRQNRFDLSITGHFLEVHVSENDETCLYCHCDVTRGQGVNITNQLATQVQVQSIVLHLRAILTNLRDCLHFMKQLANHILEYIDTATTGTLTPHLIPIPDLQQMLYQIESELPPNMHLPIPSSDPLHFYRCLQY